MDEMVQRQWEFMANGLDMGHIHHGGLGIDEERALVRKVRDAVSKIGGGRVHGWHSPGRSNSQNTLTLLAEQSFAYVTDWANDDMPYTVTTPTGPLCAMPLTYELSDRNLLVQHNLTVEEYEAQIMQAFRCLHDEALQHDSGRILSLSVSPWILGYPHRIKALERVLGRILEADSVWHATGMEILEAFKAQVGHS
jgi:allantoinase